MTLDSQPSNGAHIRLLAGHAASGRPVFEVLPARLVDAGLFELAGSPGLVLGCAAGDVLRVADDGQFEVTEQGGNLCVQAASHGPFTPESFLELRSAVEDLGGIAEAPPELRFIVVTISRTVSQSAIEQAMDAWAAGVDGVEWWFGNGDQADASH
ncbi:MULTISPECIES: DUF4265 domain-containing protein [unclassified Streptomyces]|uniref:DUF4265 domain-containing protein n=1 Tax=unclassified Streptomyces TaxID=2593676 RepID=UPI003645BD72